MSYEAAVSYTPTPNLPGELGAEPPTRCPHCGAWVDPIRLCRRARCLWTRAVTAEALVRPRHETWQRAARAAREA